MLGAVFGKVSELSGVSKSIVSAVMGILGRDRAWGIILDDEPTISVADAGPVTEGNVGTRPASFLVTLSAAYDMPVTVNYVTADGTVAACDTFARPTP